MHYQKPQLGEKLNVVPFQNGGQITDFYFVISILVKFEKKKEFFNKIWLKVGEHK